VLGEHNGEVLSQHLGYTRDEIQALEAEGVLHSGDR
jgi:crotonobetainyl-CoA:carnitine CoA-transferase CaiB-like acyl-CoA transferase